jgi:hypothetical protein
MQNLKEWDWSNTRSDLVHAGIQPKETNQSPKKKSHNNSIAMVKSRVDN